MNTIKIEIGELDPATHTYPVRLWQLSDQGGPPIAQHAIPEDLSLPGQTIAPDQFGSIVLERTGTSDEFQTIGEQLLKLLGEVGERWQQMRGGAEPTRALLEIAPETLAQMPWELICDENYKFATEPRHSFLRVHDYNAAAQPPELFPGALRLFVVAGVAATEESVAAMDEVRLIEDALRSVNRTIDVEVIWQPTLDQLAAEYQKYKPHIFHFIGHGGEKSGKAALRFTLPDKKAWGWNTTEILNGSMMKGWKPRLTFINSCRSENPSTADQQRTWSIGKTFRELGVPAVLTMQADIKGIVAGHLAGKIYEELAHGQPLDAALATARGYVTEKTAYKFEHREWALACLHLTTPPENVLPIKAANKPLAIEVFKEVVDKFVNRKPDRRRFVHGVYPTDPSEKATPPSLIVIRGEESSGKTWMAKWCMDACALQDHNLRYVEVVDGEGKDWLDVLLQIRDGHPKEAFRAFSIYQPLKEEAFHRFNWDLRDRLLGNEPREWKGEILEPPGKDLPGAKSLKELGEHFAKNTVVSFRHALVDAAEGQPLILVLDHFTNGDAKLVPAHMIDPLRLYLIDHIASNKNSLVKLVLALTDDEYRDYQFKQLEGLFHDVPLSGLAPEEFETLAKEFFRYNGVENPDKFAPLIEFYKENQVGTFWKPSELQGVYDWISQKWKKK